MSKMHLNVIFCSSKDKMTSELSQIKLGSSRILKEIVTFTPNNSPAVIGQQDPYPLTIFDSIEEDKQSFELTTSQKYQQTTNTTFSEKQRQVFIAHNPSDTK